YAWSGTLGSTVHRMPQIGELGPGVWLASGFGGQGLNTTAMAGNLLARAIIDGDQTWRQFAPFELVWAGGIAGGIAVQVRNCVRRFREGVAERKSKAGELSRLAAREAERMARETELAREASEILHTAAEPADHGSQEPPRRGGSGRHRARRK